MVLFMVHLFLVLDLTQEIPQRVCLLYANTPSRSSLLVVFLAFTKV